MIKLLGPKFQFNDVELILFDKDGTLTDSHSFWLEIINRRAAKICNYFGIEKDMLNILSSAMGADCKNKKLKPEGPVAIEGRDKVVDEIIQTLCKYDIFINKGELLNVLKIVHKEFEIDAEKYIKPIDSACNFINKLKSTDLKLALITSDSFRNANIALNRINLIDKFDLVIGGDCNYGDKKNGGPAGSLLKILIIKVPIGIYLK